jgi:hypothetical protein
MPQAEASRRPGGQEEAAHLEFLAVAAEVVEDQRLPRLPLACANPLSVPCSGAAPLARVCRGTPGVQVSGAGPRTPHAARNGDCDRFIVPAIRQVLELHAKLL